MLYHDIFSAPLSGYTNRGVCFPLTCARIDKSPAQQQQSKLHQASKAGPSRRDSSLRNQRADQEDQDKPKEQDVTKKRPPLPGRQAWSGRGLTKKKSQDFPGRLAGAAKGKYPHQDSTAPPHSDAKSLISVVSSPQVIK
jgi:hypothetical protein